MKLKVLHQNKKKPLVRFVQPSNNKPIYIGIKSVAIPEFQTQNKVKAIKSIPNDKHVSRVCKSMLNKGYAAKINNKVKLIKASITFNQYNFTN